MLERAWFFICTERGIDMTPKQRKFCLEYAASGNATQSAIKAGYSRKTAGVIGDENLKKPYIQKELEKIREEMESKKIATAKEMQETLTSIIRGDLQEEIIIVEGYGDGVSGAVTKMKSPSFRDKIKAVDTLSKMQGLYLTGTQVNIAIPVFGGELDLEE